MKRANEKENVYAVRHHDGSLCTQPETAALKAAIRKTDPLGGSAWSAQYHHDLTMVLIVMLTTAMTIVITKVVTHISTHRRCLQTTLLQLELQQHAVMNGNALCTQH